MTDAGKRTVPATPGALLRSGLGHSDPPPEFPAGTAVGEYVLERFLAAGGCGAVYSARHSTTGQEVAIKILHRELSASTEMFDRFAREARLVSQLRHPSIVAMLGFGEVRPGRPFLVMQLLPGVGLQALLERRGRFTPSETLAYLGPICGALQAAHEAGIVHRDIKANNVMVLELGETPSVKLLDFGIAKLVQLGPDDSLLTAIDQRLGTPTAMAPEQIRGAAVDARTDVYALGVLLFHLLTGRYPFRANDPAELERQHLETPAPRPSAYAPLSPAIDAVVLRCLEKLPSARFPSAVALLEAFGTAHRSSSTVEHRGASRRPALGLHLETRPVAGLEEDEEVLAAQGRLLDELEARLVREGLQIYLATGSELVAVRLLPAEPAAAQEVLRRAVALANDLVARTEDPRARVRLSVLVHRADAEVRERGTVLEVLGGPVVELEGFDRAQTPSIAAQLTPAAREAL